MGVLGVAVVVFGVVRGVVEVVNPTDEARYAQVPDLCKVIDLEPVYEVHPWETADASAIQGLDFSGVSGSSCRIFLSTPPDSDQYVTGSLRVSTSIYDDAYVGKRRFDGDVDDQTAPIQEVDGPWQRAVLGLGSDLDTGSGDLLAILWVFDGDLRLEVNFTVDSTAPATEDQLGTATQQIAASLLPQLRQEPA